MTLKFVALRMMQGKAVFHEHFFKAAAVPVQADTLVLELGPGHCAFAELDSRSYSIHRLGDLRWVPADEDMELRTFLETLRHYNLTAQSRPKVLINYTSPQFTLMPESYYSPETARQVLEFNVGSTHANSLCTDEVLQDTRMVYSMPFQLKQILDKTFPNHRLRHSGSTLCNLFFYDVLLKQRDLLLHFRDGSMEMVLKQDGQLSFYNLFKTNSEEDVLYYLLYSMEQLEAHPYTTRVVLSGEIETYGNLSSAIEKYVKNVSFATGDRLLVRKDGFETLPQHYYFTLLNRLFCE